MTPVRARVRRAALLAALTGFSLALGLPARSAAQPPAPPCRRQLAVKLTPDVENPRDPAFLNSLLGNNVGYSLTFHDQRNDDARVLLDLSGPGPRYLCDHVVDSIRRNGFVLSVDETTS